MKSALDDPEQVWVEDILLFYILPKLPVKTLFRFKSVCKKWLQWISEDPVFMREQFRSSLASPGITYINDAGLGFISLGGPPFDVPDSSPEFAQGSPLSIIASCNGLVCVGLHMCSPNPAIFVGNPLIREWSPVPMTDWARGFFALAFDPLDSRPTYKLVRSCQTGGTNDAPEFGFEVFSSDTGVWMNSREKVVIENALWFICRSVFAGGIIYWTLLGKLVCFDPQKDLATVLLPPTSVVVHNPNFALGVWKDKLTYTEMMDANVVETWIMIDFKWTRIYQANMDSAFEGINDDFCSRARRWAKIVLPYQGGDVLYFANCAVYERRSFALICYNMKTGEVTISKTYGKTWHRIPLLLFNTSFVRLPKLSTVLDANTTKCSSARKQAGE